MDADLQALLACILFLFLFYCLVGGLLCEFGHFVPVDTIDVVLAVALFAIPLGQCVTLQTL